MVAECADDSLTFREVVTILAWRYRIRSVPNKAGYGRRLHRQTYQ